MPYACMESKFGIGIITTWLQRCIEYHFYIHLKSFPLLLLGMLKNDFKRQELHRDSLEQMQIAEYGSAAFQST